MFLVIEQWVIKYKVKSVMFHNLYNIDYRMKKRKIVVMKKEYKKFIFFTLQFICILNSFYELSDVVKTKNVMCSYKRKTHIKSFMFRLAKNNRVVY